MMLSKKVVVVTGGGRGIGKAVCLKLAGEGAHIVTCSRTRSELAEVCATIERNGGQCEYAVVDVTNFREVGDFVAQTCARHGRVDVLVNNAGFCAPRRPVEEVSEEEYKQMMATNIAGVFHFTRFVVPIMKEQGNGVIITISSGCGRRGFPGLSVYSASKFAVQGFIQAVAAELGASPIRCVLVNPGGVATKMLSDLFGEEEASSQQSPAVVADLVPRVIAGAIEVPNGGGIIIRGGDIFGIYGPGE